MQGLRQHAVAQGVNNLRDAGDAGCRLGVPDVRLDRPEQQRPVGGTVVPVGGDQRLRLDRVAETGARAVRLDGVDVAGCQPGGGQRVGDDPLL